MLTSHILPSVAPYWGEAWPTAAACPPAYPFTEPHPAQNLLGGHAHLVIGADTVVEYGGHILEKPEDAADAARVLGMLSGQLHHVHTGVALIVPPHPDDEDASGGANCCGREGCIAVQSLRL